MADINLDIIKRVVYEILPGSRIILFGSRARNTNRPDSDYDLLIIIDMELTPREKMPISIKIDNNLAKYKIYADVLVEGEKEVGIKKNLPGHVIRNAMREGISI